MKLMHYAWGLLVCCIIPVDAQAMLGRLNRVKGCGARIGLAKRSAPLVLLRSLHDKRIKVLAMSSSADQLSVLKARYKCINNEVLTAIKAGGPSLLPSTYQRNPALQFPLVAIHGDLSKAATTLGSLAKDARELQEQELDSQTKQELESFAPSLEFAHNNALTIRQRVYDMPGYKKELQLALLNRLANALEAIALKR